MSVYTGVLVYAKGFDAGPHPPRADSLQPAADRRQSAAAAVQHRGHLGRRPVPRQRRAGRRGQRVFADGAAHQPAAGAVHGQRRGVQPAPRRGQARPHEDRRGQRVCDDRADCAAADGAVLCRAARTPAAHAHPDGGCARHHRVSARRLRGYSLRLPVQFSRRRAAQRGQFPRAAPVSAPLHPGEYRA